MDSPEDESYCGLVNWEILDVEVAQGLCRILQREVFDMAPTRKLHMWRREEFYSVPQESPMSCSSNQSSESDTWKPKQELRLGPKGLSGSTFYLC